MEFRIADTFTDSLSARATQGYRSSNGTGTMPRNTANSSSAVLLAGNPSPDTVIDHLFKMLREPCPKHLPSVTTGADCNMLSAPAVKFRPIEFVPCVR